MPQPAQQLNILPSQAAWDRPLKSSRLQDAYLATLEVNLQQL